MRTAYLQSMRWKFIWLVALGTLLQGCENSHEAETPISADPYSVLKNTLCDKQVVLLGEGNSHDEGTTNEFKSQLARDLIQNCGFSLIVFEASFYQFVNLNRNFSTGNQISRQELDASIGWFWRNQVETETLMKALHEEANDGQVTIAGMDDQIAGRGQDYANFELPAELTEGLEIEQQTKCRAAIKQHVYQAYKDGDRYDAGKKQLILSCLEAPNDSENEQIAAMRASLIRDYQRDFLGGEAHYIGRARSMYNNFEYWFDNRGKPKTIIWSSTVHAAKIGRLSPSFGEQVQDRFGDDAYTLGFSALSGSRGHPGRDAKALPEAPDTAIEAIVFKDAEDDILFVDSKTLAAFGTAPAAALTNKYEIRDWAAELDGLIVFRTQRPQTLMPTSKE